ncbi:11521_t:CDS:2 [Cetraspora pellucida]|uniref:11521_t:CDS:1 n=1 Tax=Cetraspora pellucida TaxID=1433469 RepID=A0ACA9L5F6_9GLOM|nr:11521_t:CDS:2 [Cetraspora pellucida]
MMSKFCNDEQEIEIHDTLAIETQQALLNELIYLVGGLENVIEIWSVKVDNSITMKHHILLLKNQSHICSCLMVIQQGIVCRHYFKVMLMMDIAKFHIRLIPLRWYYEDINVSNKLFLRADKFYEEKLIEETASPITYLCAFS